MYNFGQFTAEKQTEKKHKETQMQKKRLKDMSKKHKKT